MEAKRIPQYDVCAGETIQDLRIQVQLKMQAGWVPQGGMVVYGGALHQAMVRHLEDVPTDNIYHTDLHHEY